MCVREEGEGVCEWTEGEGGYSFSFSLFPSSCFPDHPDNQNALHNSLNSSKIHILIFFLA